MTEVAAAGQFNRIEVELATIRGEITLLRREWDTGQVNMGHRVAELESWQTWATRLMLTLVITAVVGAGITGTIIATVMGF